MIGTDLPVVTAPFTVLVDSREQAAYSFLGLTAGFKRGNPPVIVPTQRTGLLNGDYSLLGYPSLAIERKSPADLYGSVVRRQNFVGRLERMSELCREPRNGYAAVVVEAELKELIERPPKYCKLHPRSLSRTLIAWGMRYPIHWHFVRDREMAEVLTYRLLERFYIDHCNERDLPDSGGMSDEELDRLDQVDHINQKDILDVDSVTLDETGS